MEKNILCLPGDGIGSEVMNATCPLVEKVAAKFGHKVNWSHGLIGFAAYDKTGDTMPEVTWQQLEAADGVFFGAVGLPDRDKELSAEMRPEKRALLPMRKRFGMCVNIRPVRVYEGLEHLSPLRANYATGVNLTFLREINSGIYFGKRHIDEVKGYATDECYYSKEEIERIARFAFELARQTGQPLTSVDKANVLNAIGLYWRKVVNELHQKEYSDVKLDHCLVDAFNLYLFTKPSSFRLVLTSNMFGDILSDGAAGLAGSLGLLPSASLNPDNNFCLYEPSGGSAPDIAGKNLANPIAMILCASLLFRHTYKDEAAAQAIDSAVQKALAQGYRTRDLVREGDTGTTIVSTLEMAQAISSFL